MKFPFRRGQHLIKATPGLPVHGLQENGRLCLAEDDERGTDAPTVESSGDDQQQDSASAHLIQFFNHQGGGLESTSSP